MQVMAIKDLIVKDEEQRLITGYASVEVMDRQGDLVPIDTMNKAMIKYASRGAPLLFGHQNKPVGKVINWTVQEEPRYGLPAIEITAMIDKGYKLDDEVWNMIKNGTITGFSIGGTAIQVDTEKTAEGVDARVLKEIELSEISLVTEPANQAAIITAYSMAKSVDPYENLSESELEKKGEEVISKIFMDLIKSGEFGKKSYPWRKCMEENHSAKLCGWIKSRYGHKGLGMEDLSKDFIMHEFITKRAQPSKWFLEKCSEKALDVEGNPRDSIRLCAYIFYHEFQEDLRKAEDWAESTQGIPKEWIEHHNIHAYYKYRQKSTIIDLASSAGELPDETWYAKCLVNYGGEVSPQKACNYLWYSGYGWEVNKDATEEFPIVDLEIKEIEKGVPELDELLKELIEIQKPFAGMKNWADCMKKIGSGKKKYSKEAKQRICGSLKHKYEKGLGSSKIVCPNCDGHNVSVEDSDMMMVKETEGMTRTNYYDVLCKDCNIQFREYTFAKKQPIFFLLEPEVKKN
jgi:HK97 family phage prohead protease